MSESKNIVDQIEESSLINGLRVQGVDYVINYEYLANKPDMSQYVRSAIIVIPYGRMRGDIDGDGLITENDVTILSRHVSKISVITDVTGLSVADINNDGYINADDHTLLARVISGIDPIGMYGEVSGNWNVNPNYLEDGMQFYTDVSVNGMTASDSAIVSIKGNHSKNEFRAECLDGAIRVYAKLCPISSVAAIVQFSSGDGSAVVLCDSVGSITNKIVGTLLADGWIDNLQTIHVSSVTSDNVVIVGSTIESLEYYSDFGVVCTGQSDGSLTFTCESKPSVNITVNIVTID